MEQPNYVLRTVEAVFMPKKNNAAAEPIRIIVWVIIGIIIVGSFIFQDNLFAELSWSARVFLIILALGVTFATSGLESVPSPMELQFYDDYFIFYKPKRYYSKRVTRMSYITMKYSEVTKCAYLTRAQRFQIYGSGKSVWYNYRKDGTLPPVPTESRMVKGGMIYFDVSLAPNVDFIREIETHSPMRVVLEDR